MANWVARFYLDHPANAGRMEFVCDGDAMAARQQAIDSITALVRLGHIQNLRPNSRFTIGFRSVLRKRWFHFWR